MIEELGIYNRISLILSIKQSSPRSTTRVSKLTLRTLTKVSIKTTNIDADLIFVNQPKIHSN